MPLEIVNRTTVSVSMSSVKSKTFLPFAMTSRFPSSRLARRRLQLYRGEISRQALHNTGYLGGFGVAPKPCDPELRNETGDISSW